MSSTRILLAELSPALRQALVPVLANQVDVELVGDVSGAIEILLAVGETRADVVVLGMPGIELPGIAGQLLDEYPQLKVLAVNLNRQRALLDELRPQLLLIGEVTSEGLLEAIRTDAQPGCLGRAR